MLGVQGQFQLCRVWLRRGVRWTKEKRKDGKTEGKEEKKEEKGKKESDQVRFF